jgi:hypothetical protein
VCQSSRAHHQAATVGRGHSRGHFEKTTLNFGGMIEVAFIHPYLRLMCG